MALKKDGVVEIVDATDDSDEWVLVRERIAKMIDEIDSLDGQFPIGYCFCLLTQDPDTGKVMASAISVLSATDESPEVAASDLRSAAWSATLAVTRSLQGSVSDALDDLHEEAH